MAAFLCLAVIVAHPPEKRTRTLQASSLLALIFPSSKIIEKSIWPLVSTKVPVVKQKNDFFSVRYGVTSEADVAIQKKAGSPLLKENRLHLVAA